MPFMTAYPRRNEEGCTVRRRASDPGYEPALTALPRDDSEPGCSVSRVDHLHGSAPGHRLVLDDLDSLRNRELEGLDTRSEIGLDTLEADPREIAEEV